MASIQTLLSPRHTLNVVSEPRPDRTLELMEVSKGLLDAIIVLNQKRQSALVGFHHLLQPLIWTGIQRVPWD